jgi:hypothetical protein
VKGREINRVFIALSMRITHTKMFAALSLAATGLLLAGGVAFAAGPGGFWGGDAGRLPWTNGNGSAHPAGIFGTVTAVNGTTLTIESPNRGFGPRSENAATNAPTSTSYTVDAANASVMKDGASSTIANVNTGDKVLARGTVSGTTVTANAIYDGVLGPNVNPGGPMRRAFEDGTSTWDHWNGSSTWSSRPTGTALALLQGNGDPIVGGTVTAVNNGMFTITNAGKVTYSIDAEQATVVKGNATSSYAAIAVNDRVIVQGAVNGTSVTASSVIDQGPLPGSANGTSTSSTGPAAGVGGFFRGIGLFFRHLFGFF